MITLDIYGSVVFTALLFFVTLFEANIELVMSIFIVSAVVWYHVKDWMEREANRSKLQERINKL